MAGVEKSARVAEKDEIIIKEGDESKGEIFFMRKGQAAAEIADKYIGTINAGEFFGEVAAILNTKRGATVRAIVRCELDVFAGLQDDKLMRIIQREPKIGQRMIQTLAKRLQETSLDAAGQLSGKSQLIERYRKAISGTVFALEKLTMVYKAPYLTELLEHLTQHSGIQLGNQKDADETIFRKINEIIAKV
jgi:CRP-like cAMP-binding protein